MGERRFRYVAESDARSPIDRRRPLRSLPFQHQGLTPAVTWQKTAAGETGAP
jgi:hypothetical protein